MTFKALVIDTDALGTLDAAIIEDHWFDDFAVPPNAEGLRRVERGQVLFLLATPLGDESGILVIDLAPDGPLLGPPKRRAAFERILRVAMRHFDRSVALPIAWQPYHEDSLISIYAQQPSGGMRSRIYFDQAPAGDANIFAYALTDQPRQLSSTEANVALYRRAAAEYQHAALIEEESPPPAGGFSIHLTQPLGFQLAGGGTLSEWYDRRLNPDQVAFVNRPADRPIRLRGAAGTGKTQSMVIKCLRDLYADHDAGGDKRFAFLTHSSALAHEVIRGMLYALDPSQRFEELRDTHGQQKLWIGTLYELAQQQLNYKDKGLKPLSLDGREGRELQRLLISDAIDQVVIDPHVALTHLAEAPAAFGDRLRTPERRSELVDELMNEFACVLDADNVKRGTDAAERYVKATRRESWQMALPSAAERQVVLDVHHGYRAALKREELLSMDQMVADFDQYLSTHEWERLRERQGFDLIFVDEYHYFTRVEAMTLHNLFKTRAQVGSAWPLIMAYDLKQSTSDAALGGGIERFRNPGVGVSVELALKKVYRSTPQITAFLQDLDASFPAMDLEGEYGAYPGQSAKEDGPVPDVLEYNGNLLLIDDIFKIASERARQLSDGSQVAVLCLNEALFDTYRMASRIQDKLVAITTREDLRELRYARRRCVFSMPEYVAGLQFDTVFLIHADEADLADDQGNQGARRRYISRLYVGASRAAHRLTVATSRERGGLNPILTRLVLSGRLRFAAEG